MLDLEDANRFIENAKDRNKDPYDLLLEIVDTEIKLLEFEKTKLIVQKKCKDNPEIVNDILKIFEVLDCFEAQRKLYEENKGNK